MDDSLLELEKELKRLSPRRPSRELLAALEREFAPASRSGDAAGAARSSTATTVRSWKWATWALAGAAAALALALALHTAFERISAPVAAPTIAGQMAPADPATEASPAPRVTPDRYEPVQASSVFYAMHESQPTTLPDRSEGREVRYRFVDTYTWKNPARNASIRWSVPRDEVRLIRANLD